MPSYLIGIDEAGYGPMLGPLVVTASVFEISAPARRKPINLPPYGGAHLWKTLSAICSDSPNRCKGRIPVCDSKKIYQPARGLGALERAVWSFANTLPVNPFTGYTDLQLPLTANRAEIITQTGLLAAELARKSVNFSEVCLKIIDAVQFNDGIKAHHNKAEFLFHITGQLLAYIRHKYGRRGDLYIAIGKQGGRAYYRHHIQNTFDGCGVTVVSESNDRSCYHIANSNECGAAAESRLLRGEAARRINISFLKDGEDRDFCIALASMFGKYTRELEMLRFNALFRRHLPQLKPTAGYPTDARRFIREITPFCRQNGWKMEKFIRIR